MKIFVYGTLREFCSNNHRLKRSLKISDALVYGELYHVSWYPALLIHKENVSKLLSHTTLGIVNNLLTTCEYVFGDIYEIDEALLPELDDFEGVSGSVNDEYRRESHTVLGVDGELHEAEIWVWNLSVSSLQQIQSGDWKTYAERV